LGAGQGGACKSPSPGIGGGHTPCGGATQVGQPTASNGPKGTANVDCPSKKPRLAPKGQPTETGSKERKTSSNRGGPATCYTWTASKPPQKKGGPKTLPLKKN